MVLGGGVPGVRLQILLSAALSCILFSVGCTHTRSYRVRPGDTLYRIGQRYGVSWQELARLNGIDDPSRIEIGDELRIPGDRKPQSVDSFVLQSADRPQSRVDAESPVEVRLSWPLDSGSVSSGFGPRGGSFHDGIDLSAPAGTPVKAADSGEVVFSDVLRGYGNVVVIRHARDYITVYAHNERNLVDAGKKVRRGQVIATVGQSGRTTGSNLHFEVRRNNVVRNPLRFLPASRIAAPRSSLDIGG